VRHTYKLGDRRVGVRSTSAAFGEWLDGVLGERRTKRNDIPFYSVVVGSPPSDNGNGGLKGRELNILYEGVSPVVRTLDLSLLARVLLGELESPLFPARRDAIFTRSSLIHSNGATALVPGWVAPHVGELGRRVQRAGVSLPLTMSTAVDPETGSAVPIRPLIELPDDAHAGLATMAQPGRDGDRVEITEPTPVDVVVVHDDVEVDLYPVSRATALRRVMATVANLETVRATALEGLGRMVAGARCYAIGYGRRQLVLEQLAEAMADARAG
jgi:hypothetical protein